jgi:carbon monoxide dehydrogenase subunit G
MRVTGTGELPFGPDESFRRLSDVERLGHALPSVQAVNVESEDRFTAAFRPTTGLGATPVRMTFTVTDRQAPARLRVEGNGGATDSAVHLRCDLDLAPSDGGTAVSWAVDAQVLGVLRSLTQRVLPSLVEDQVVEVLAAVRDGGGSGDGGGEDPAPGDAARSGDEAPAREDDPPLDPEHVERIAGAGADADDVADPERYHKGPGW